MIGESDRRQVAPVTQSRLHGKIVKTNPHNESVIAANELPDRHFNDALAAERPPSARQSGTDTSLMAKRTSTDPSRIDSSK